MKIVEQIDVVNAGTFGASLQWKEAAAEVEAAVAACDWPVGSGKFTINPQKHGNGVKAPNWDGWQRAFRPFPMMQR